MISSSALKQELNNLSGLLYDSATTGVNPLTSREFTERASYLPTAAQRLTVRGLTFALKHGGQPYLERLATRAYKGQTVLGLGHHSVVLADGNYGVRKILHRTHIMTPEEQVNHVATLEKLQDRLVEPFGQRLFTQRFTIEPFPPNPQYSSVTAYQARVVSGVPSDVMQPSPVMINYLAECRELYDQTGIMPDIIGKGNSFESVNGLAIVDTIPLSAQNPGDAQALLLAGKVMRMNGLGEGLDIEAIV